MKYTKNELVDGAKDILDQIKKDPDTIFELDLSSFEENMELDEHLEKGFLSPMDVVDNFFEMFSDKNRFEISMERESPSYCHLSYLLFQVSFFDRDISSKALYQGMINAWSVLTRNNNLILEEVNTLVDKFGIFHSYIKVCLNSDDQYDPIILSQDYEVEEKYTPILKDFIKTFSKIKYLGFCNLKETSEYFLIDLVMHQDSFKIRKNVAEKLRKIAKKYYCENINLEIIKERKVCPYKGAKYKSYSYQIKITALNKEKIEKAKLARPSDIVSRIEEQLVKKGHRTPYSHTSIYHNPVEIYIDCEKDNKTQAEDILKDAKKVMKENKYNGYKLEVVGPTTTNLGHYELVFDIYKLKISVDSNKFG